MYCKIELAGWFQESLKQGMGRTGNPAKLNLEYPELDNEQAFL